MLYCVSDTGRLFNSVTPSRKTICGRSGILPEFIAVNVPLAAACHSTGLCLNVCSGPAFLSVEGETVPKFGPVR